LLVGGVGFLKPSVARVRAAGLPVAERVVGLLRPVLLAIE
jgi:hypothetical protein